MSNINKEKNVSLRFVIAIFLPFAACLLQWILWPFISPFVWFLFFPAVFFSAQIGSMTAGIVASFISAFLVWYCFIPPQLSLSIEDPKSLFSIGLFMAMGVLFSHTHDSLKKANKKAVAALESAQTANEQLQGANERISNLYQKTLELDKLKTQFFSNVSHELRTPLTLILGPLNKCLAEPGLSHHTLSNLDLIKRNAQLLYHHVNDLLDISKIEAGWKEVRYAHVDLAHLFRVIGSHFESVAEDRHIRYTVSAPQTLPAQIDVEMFQRILLNLLSNAFKFAPDSGIIELAMDVQDNQAILTIRDNGPGVPSNMCEAIFERFYQVEGHAARSHEGTGLGLSIVKEFTELLGGTVHCSEAPGGGALFTLSMPLTAPQGAHVEDFHEDISKKINLFHGDVAERHSEAPAGHSQRPGPEPAPHILIVEDNEDMNGFIAALLAPHYRISSAFNGEEGMEKAMQLQPDMIIADVMMPKMSGDQMVHELRQNHHMTDVPIVMLTAKSDQELRVKLLQHGVQDYLEKPFSSEELLARVDRLMAERRRTFEQLRASETKYRTLADSGQALIWTSGLDKKCDYFNKPWLEFTGRTLAQELGDGWVEGVHPDDLAHCVEIYSSAFDQHERFRMEYRLRHASGSYRWIQDDGTPRFDGDGIFLGYIGHCFDITERKRAEEEREKLQSQLNQAQKMESVGRLAGGVAHDFNNILSVIMGYTEMALESVDPALPLHSDLEKIFESATRSTNIVRQLLAFSRKQVVSPKVLDLNQTIDGMLKMLRRLIGENIELNRIPSHVLLTIKIDPSQVDQILANLCVNARDAIDNIGKITIETKAVSVGEEYCYGNIGVAPGKYAILIVSDNGKGMEKEVVDKIFEPFFTTKGDAGTGLGLSTVYGIAQQNNGFVNVYSEPNKGTTFKVYIPLHSDEPVQIEKEKYHEFEMSNGETILFVEDDQSLLELGLTMLNKLGYDVLSTNSPREALRIASEYINKIDLLITDVIMPEMNGKELASQLLLMYPNLKILYQSGYTANVIAHHGIIDEGINFLQKPFSRKDLSHKIREVLG